jgi:thiol-disulfide isomerase/thioredoxin
MDTTLLIARLLLSSVFIVAGVAKLLDQQGSRRAIIEFGLPAFLAAPLGLLLPLAELAVAGALIPAATALWGAIGALTLLLLFITIIGLNLARGRKPDCRCFGQLHSASAGWKTLARNGALATLAGFLVLQGWEGKVGPNAIAWVGTLSMLQLLGLVGGVLMLGLLVIQWWVLLHLLRQNGRVLVRLEAIESNLATGSGVAPSQNGVHAQPAAGLPVGAKAPGFSLQGLYGETLPLGALLAPGKPVILFFTEPKCGPCNALLPEIGRWQEEHDKKLTLALISRGTPEESRAKFSEHGLSKVLLQQDREVLEAYEVRGTPSAVVVRPDGTIGSPVAGGSEAIQSLVRQVVEAPSPNAALLPKATESADAPNGNGGPCPKCGKRHLTEAAPAKPPALKIGEQVPEIKLEDLSGKEIDLKEDFEGANTVVLFWNPGCGFCQQMLPDLKEWETNPPEGAPKLLVVSAGGEEANKAMDLMSPVVLDQSFSVGREFGAGGTPSAVLLDAEGKVASVVAKGAPAVLELVKAGKPAT